MSCLERIAPIILTFNEAPNIGRTLERLRSFPEVLIVDSGSTDETLEIVRRFANIRVVSRPFDNHAAQWNFGLSQCAERFDWVLALDADYRLPPALVAEIAEMNPDAGFAGYRVGFRYCVFGKPLKHSLYPMAVALYRRRHAHYVQDGHTQRVVVEGSLGELRNRIDHDDRKSLIRWLASQAKYADLEAALLESTPWGRLNLKDKIRCLIVVAPWLVPLYCLTAGRGLLDGWAGIFYALQRGVGESAIAIALLEKRLGRKP